VVCVDEKTQVQALDRTAPVLPLLPGTPQRATHDDTRHGTTNLYAALDVTSGKVLSQLSPATAPSSSSDSWSSGPQRARRPWGAPHLR
jgi:hypothetical protein